MKTLMFKKILLFVTWALIVILLRLAISESDRMGWSLFAAFISPIVIAIIFSWMPKKNQRIAKNEKRSFNIIKIKNYAIASSIIGLIRISVFIYLCLAV